MRVCVTRCQIEKRVVPMKVSDPDWFKFFGTTDSQLEPIPGKTKPAKPKRHQREAKLIIERPSLLRAPQQRQLFDTVADDH